jgi:GNAT superfamily N-acetyltransferase
MQSETRTTDSKARLVLPKSFANATVIVEQISETEIRVKRAKVVAEDELQFSEETATTLTDRDRDLFIKMLSKPSVPNAALKKAAVRHKARNIG